MPEIVKGAVKNPSSALIAFKPRQVLLAEQHQKPSPSSSLPPNNPTFMAVMEKKQQQLQSAKTLTAEQSIQLLHSVLRYLESNSFSKSIKSLLKESQIQGDSWKSSSLDLADIYCKYLENCIHVDAKLASQKELDIQGDKSERHGNAAAFQETVSKKKKKKADEKDNSKSISSHKDTGLEVKLKKQKDEKMDYLTDATLTAVRDPEIDMSSKKQRKKEKNKLTSESLDQDAKQSDLNLGLTEERLKNNNDGIDFEEASKSKDRENKNKPDLELLIEDQKLSKSKRSTKLVDDKSKTEVLLDESEDKPKEKKRKKEDKEKKYSVASENWIDDANGTKKRKRSTSHENQKQPVAEPALEESKRRKIEGLEESKSVDEKGAADKLVGRESQGGKESKRGNGNVNVHEGEIFSINQVGESTNGNSKNGIQKSGQRRQQNGSAEPKTVNAFQRVKVDEVQFVDDRLQDNSYWAKDGAETGYGSKAQEVLGQVKGRDFRHKKTKQKRGSYRGGQIDVQSHSIKFNYSDEE